jgi:hypothetical protein
MRFEILIAVSMKNTVVRDVAPCSMASVHLHSGLTHYIVLQVQRRSQESDQQEQVVIYFLVVACLAYSSNLKMAVHSSETSVKFQRTTRRYIPEYKTLHKLLLFRVILKKHNYLRNSCANRLSCSTWIRSIISAETAGCG